jgi:hypothetical protein
VQMGFAKRMIITLINPFNRDAREELQVQCMREVLTLVARKWVAKRKEMNNLVGLNIPAYDSWNIVEQWLKRNG